MEKICHTTVIEPNQHTWVARELFCDSISFDPDAVPMAFLNQRNNWWALSDTECHFKFIAKRSIFLFKLHTITEREYFRATIENKETLKRLLLIIKMHRKY